MTLRTLTEQGDAETRDDLYYGMLEEHVGKEHAEWLRDTDNSMARLKRFGASPNFLHNWEVIRKNLIDQMKHEREYGPEPEPEPPSPPPFDPRAETEAPAALAAGGNAHRERKNLREPFGEFVMGPKLQVDTEDRRLQNLYENMALEPESEALAKWRKANGGGVHYERIPPSLESQKSGIAYARVPRTGEPQDEPRLVHYEKPVYGGSLKGAFRIPRSAIIALGKGSLAAGLKVVDDLFGHHGALGRGVVSPMMLGILGDGDEVEGRKILRRFIAKAREAHAKA